MPLSADLERLVSLYAAHPLTAKNILRRLEKDGITLENITEIMLATDDATCITDQNHIGGVQFARELAKETQIASKDSVLDVGTGLGGTARILASEFGCKVHGIDIVPARYADAVYLTELCDLQDKVSFQCGDFLACDFPQKKFDVIVSQSSFSHFADLSVLLSRCRELLAEGGRLAFEESYLRRAVVDQAEAEALEELTDCWACHFFEIDAWHGELENQGFELLEETDLSLDFRAHFRQLYSQTEQPFGEPVNSIEVRGWEHALSLEKSGLLGYLRVVARS